VESVHPSVTARFTAAFKAKDVNAIMANYVTDESLIVFDVAPPAADQRSAGIQAGRTGNVTSRLYWSLGHDHERPGNYRGRRC
jgi:ketosteroid isomerase-like protein